MAPACGCAVRWRRRRCGHPAPCTCPSCGGALRRIGEDITETLDYVPGRFKVIRHIREKLSCRACDTGGLSSAGYCGGFPVPGKEIGDTPGRMIADTGEDVSDIEVWVQAVELGALDQ